MGSNRCRCPCRHTASELWRRNIVVVASLIKDSSSFEASLMTAPSLKMRQSLISVYPSHLNYCLHKYFPLIRRNKEPRATKARRHRRAGFSTPGTAGRRVNCVRIKNVTRANRAQNNEINPTVIYYDVVTWNSRDRTMCYETTQVYDANRHLQF